MKPTLEDLSTFDWIYENVVPTKIPDGDGTTAIDYSKINEKMICRMINRLNIKTT